MIPVMQTKRGGSGVPPEERGDCLAACLASLLEVPIEDVPIPHGDDDGPHWWDLTQAALRPHGWRCVVADRRIYPDGYWLAFVPSRNLRRESGEPESHVIVMHDGQVAHDPSLGDRYALGTSIEDLEVQSAYVLVPLVIRTNPPKERQ